MFYLNCDWYFSLETGGIFVGFKSMAGSKSWHVEQTLSICNA